MDNYDLDKGGVKFDAGKIRMDLVPQDAVLAVASVFTYGALKYDDWNWSKGMRVGRLLAAMDRHKTAYLLGEEVDPESGMPHTWHMGCCILMLIAADLRCVSEDDREPAWGAYHDVLETFAFMKKPESPKKDSEAPLFDESEWEKKKEFARAMEIQQKYSELKAKEYEWLGQDGGIEE